MYYIKNFKPKDGINPNHRKVKHYKGGMSVVVYHRTKTQNIHDIIDLRFYYTGSRMYACVWICDHIHNIYASGSGWAGGYGYHLASAAAQEALENAGVTFKNRIHSVGDTAVEHALLELAKKLFPNTSDKNFMIKTSHA